MIAARTLSFYFILFLFGSSVSSCTSSSTSKNPSEILATLKEGEAKVVFTIDNQPFYGDSSVFKGEITAFDHAFRINITDQFQGNTVIAIGGDQWFATKPITKAVDTNNQTQASAMIGRMTDPVNRRGLGYIMTSGEITLEALSEEKAILRLKGQVGEYTTMGNPATWKPVEGLIVYKKPLLKVQGLTPQQLYF